MRNLPARAYASLAKNLLSTVVLLSVLLPAWAQVVYFDNFQQFAPGTDLTTTTYTPASGPLGATATTRVLNGSPTITASNLLGRNCAFFDNSVLTNKSEYRATPSQPLTNQILELTCNLLIKSTNAGEGLFMFSVPTTDPVANYNPPLAFMDTGLIAVFTNAPSQPATVVGSWASLANTFMTNRLILNYPERKLWYALNAQPIAGLPLGTYFSNNVDKLTFTAFERSSGSLGNQFALDDVKVQIRSLAPTITSIQTLGANVAITFTTLPDSLYAVQSCATLPTNSWATVTNNVPGTADPVQVTDSTTSGVSQRFYRVVKTQ